MLKNKKSNYSLIQQQLFTYFRKISSDKRKSVKSFLLLEQLINSFPYPVICLDRQGSVVISNNAALDLKLPALSTGQEICKAVKTPIKLNDLIHNNKEVSCPLEICDQHFSILLKGSSQFKLAFLYFQDTRSEQINQKLKKYSNRLQETLEDEKQKLACELHDTIGQDLLSLRIKLQKHRDLFAFYNSTDEYQNMLNLLEQSFNHIKMISYSLKPRILDEMGLGPALISFCHSISDATGIKCSIDIINCQDQLDARLEAHLYRIIQETLHNRLSNSDLTEFNIQLIDSPLSVKIFFTDNGTDKAPGRLSLKEFSTYSIALDFIKEKVESMEGTMKIDSSPENGTIIIVEIPKKVS